MNDGRLEAIGGGLGDVCGVPCPSLASEPFVCGHQCTGNECLFEITNYVPHLLVVSRSFRDCYSCVTNSLRYDPMPASISPIFFAYHEVLNLMTSTHNSTCFLSSIRWAVENIHSSYDNETEN